MIRTAILAALALVCVALPAEARQHRPSVQCVETGSVMFPVCGMVQPFSGARSIRVTMHRERLERSRRVVQRQPAVQAPMLRFAASNEEPNINTRGQVIGGRPSGCPNAFCGCGASLHLFGRIIPSLNLAANWFKFPRAAPAPGMAAVRNHHVFVLEQPINGDVWLVHDSNSGGHATRLHPRSIAGYVIVNPHGGVS